MQSKAIQCIIINLKMTGLLNSLSKILCILKPFYGYQYSMYFNCFFLRKYQKVSKEVLQKSNTSNCFNLVTNCKRYMQHIVSRFDQIKVDFHRQIHRSTQTNPSHQLRIGSDQKGPSQRRSVRSNLSRSIWRNTHPPIYHPRQRVSKRNR